MSALDTQQIKNDIASVYTTNDITYAADIRPFLEAFTDDIDAAIDAVTFEGLPDTAFTISNMAAGDIIQLNSNGNFEAYTPPWIEDLSSFTTDDLSEGSTNLYFTDARAVTALNGQDISILNNDVPYVVNSSGSDAFVPVYSGSGTITTSFIQEDQAVADGFWKFGDPAGIPVALKVSGGEFQFKNEADTAFAPIRVGDVIWEGSPIELNKEVVEIHDNFQLLNSDLSSGDPKEDAGVDINRPDATNARILYNEGNGQWELGLVGSTSKIFVDGDEDNNTIKWDGTTLSVHAVTGTELEQVANINSLGISNNNWSHVSTMDQDVTSTSDVTFDRVRAPHFKDEILNASLEGTDNAFGTGGSGAVRINGVSTPTINGIAVEGFIDGDHLRIYVDPNSDPITFNGQNANASSSLRLVIDDAGGELVGNPKAHIDFKRCESTNRWLLAGYNQHLVTYNP